MTYKAAIIGCGHRSRAHLDAYRHIDRAEAVACCDLSPTHRDQVADEYGLRAYDDAERMVREEAPDIVHIVTPPTARVELMTLVSDHGVPLCTVEKPIAVGVDDWRALGELERTSATRFAVCHQFRWQPHLVKCQNAVATGAIGPVKFLDCSAGTYIANQGTHALNYGRSLIGEPRVVRVFGNVSGWAGDDQMHPSPVTTEAVLTFNNGVRGSWTNGRISPRVGDADTAWQHLRVAVFGDLGRVHYEEFGSWAIVSEETREEGTFGGMDVWRRNNDLAQAAFHRAMFAWLEDPTRVPGTNLADSLHEWAVVLAVYRSALIHQPVNMESFDPSPDLVENVRKLGCVNPDAGVS